MFRFLTTLLALFFTTFSFSQTITIFNDSYYQVQYNGDVSPEILKSTVLFKAEDASFSALRTNRDDASIHKRYALELHGYPVRGCQITSHYNILQDVTTFFVKSQIPDGNSLENYRVILKDELIHQVKSMFPSSEYSYFDYPKNNREEGVVYVSRTNTYDKPEWVLAVQLDVISHEPLFSKSIYFDAITGDFLFTEENLCSSHDHSETNTTCTTSTPGTAVTKYHGEKQIETTEMDGMYVLLDETRGTGIRTLNRKTGGLFKDHDNFWDNNNYEQDEVAGDVHWGSEFTFDYYQEQLNLHGLNGNGLGFIAYAHEDGAQAYWTGGSASFGDGSPSSDQDLPWTYINVVAHEYSHGVTDYAADLIYRGESGGLNEAFSDIMGMSVENASNPGVVTWKVGDKFSSNGLSFRDMANPNSKSMASTYEGLYYDSNDGVHSLSSLANLWFYLLVEGGTGENDNQYNYDVNSIGWTNATQIVYNTWTNYLTSGSDYDDCARFSLIEAGNLFGECSAEYSSVKEAWYAVGLLLDVPEIEFEASYTYFCESPATATFSLFQDLTEVYWDFGDGGNSTEKNPTHTYLENGSYSVSVNGIDCNGNYLSAEKIDFIYVNEADFACDTFLLTGITEMIDCSGTIIDDGGIDGNYSISTFSSLTLTNPYEIGYKIDVNLFKSELFHDYMVIESYRDEEVVQSYTLNSFSYLNGQQIVLLGDEIKITFLSDYSETYDGFVLDYECILPNTPEAYFYTPNTVTCNQNVQLYDTSSFYPNSWEWYLNEELVSTDQHPLLFLDTEGSYDLRLIACSAAGCDTIEKLSYLTYDPVNLYCDTITMLGYQNEISNSCAGVLVDNGGPINDYSRYIYSELLLDVEGVSGYELEFTQFEIEDDSDFLKIFSIDGTDTLLVSKNIEFTEGLKIEILGKKLLFLFESNYTEEYAGFIINWNCITPQSEPIADFNYSYNTCYQDLVLENNSSANSTDFEWFLNDVSISSDRSLLLNLIEEGVYDIALISCNNFGCDTMSISNAVTIGGEGPQCDSIVMSNNSELILNQCEGIIYGDGEIPGSYSNSFYSEVIVEAENAHQYDLEYSFRGSNSDADALKIYGWNGTDYGLLQVISYTSLNKEMTITASKFKLTWETQDLNANKGFEVKWVCSDIAVAPSAAFSLLGNGDCEFYETVINRTAGITDSWNWYVDGEVTSTEYEPALNVFDFQEHTVWLEACNSIGCDSSNVIVYQRQHCINAGLVEVCAGTLYDDGGANRDYKDDKSSQTTIYSEDAAGFSVNLDFFETEYYYDELIISSGDDIDNLTEFIRLSGKVPGTIYFVPGQYLDFKFIADSLYNRDGFEIEYECVSKEALPKVDIEYVVDECSNAYSFTANSINTDSYVWNFSEGDEVDGESANHTFSEFGNYTVTLTTTNENGTNTHEIQVKNEFIPLSITTIGEILINTTETVEIQSHGFITSNSRKWFINDELITEGKKLDITFTEVSTNTIKCEVVDKKGCLLVEEFIVEARTVLNNHDLQEDSRITVYPNPANDYIDIISDSFLENGTRIIIYDMSGKIIKTQELLQDSDQVRVNISDFIDGLYIVNVQENQQSTYLKVVKN